MSQFSAEFYKNSRNQVVQKLSPDQLIASAHEVADTLALFADRLNRLYPAMQFRIDSNMEDKYYGTKPEKLSRKTDYVKITMRAEDIAFAHRNAPSDKKDDFHSLLNDFGIEVVSFNDKSKTYRGQAHEQTYFYRLAVPIKNRDDGAGHIVQMEIERDANLPEWTPQQDKQVERAVKTSQMQVSTAAKMARALCEDINIDYYNNETCLIADPKSIERYTEKAIIEYDGDVGKVKDGTRLMLLFEEAEQIDDLRHATKNKHSNFHKQLAKAGYEIYETKDLFDTPKELGYMAYMFWVRPIGATDNTESIEFQVTQKHLQWEYNPRTHDIYEEHRPQIERYRQANIPISQWDETTKKAAYEIRQIHFEGAQSTGVINYVKNWPFNENDGIERYQKDIPPLEYIPISYERIAAPLANVKLIENYPPILGLDD